MPQFEYEALEHRTKDTFASRLERLRNRSTQNLGAPPSEDLESSDESYEETLKHQNHFRTGGKWV